MIIIYALLLNHTRLMYRIKNTRMSDFNFLGYNLNILILSYPPPFGPPQTLVLNINLRITCNKTYFLRQYHSFK